MLCEYSRIFIVLIILKSGIAMMSPVIDYANNGSLFGENKTLSSIGNASYVSISTNSPEVVDCISPPIIEKCNNSGAYWFFNYPIRLCVATGDGHCIKGKRIFKSIADCQRGCARFTKTSTIKVTRGLQMSTDRSKLLSDKVVMMTQSLASNTSRRLLDKDPCFGKAMVGSCDYGSHSPKYSLIRYTFVPSVSQCHRVLYSGCRPHENLFDDSNDCKSSCEYRLFNSLMSPRCQEAYVNNCVHYTTTANNDSSYPIRYHFSSSKKHCVSYNSINSPVCLNQFFPSMDECHKFCRPRPATEEMLQNRCFGELVVESQSCSSNQRSSLWFYMAAINQCVQYSTCPIELGGNVFHTKSQCEDSCLATNIYTVCSLPMDPGKGSEIKWKFFFDLQVRKCRIFPYKGSLGNLNRFGTIDECNETCGRVMPRAIIGVSESRASQASALVNDSSRMTPGNNTPRSLYVPALDQVITGRDYCLEEPLYGTCHHFQASMYITKYVYNYHRGRCEPLKFSGCGPIGRNSFTSLSLCDEMCTRRMKPAKSSLCTRITSWCSNSSWIYWRYNEQGALCELFPSCSRQSSSEEALFTSEDQCTRTCVPPLPRRSNLFDVCHLPPTNTTDQCSSSVKRWFYLSHKRTCVEGNSCISYGNNFVSKSSCLDACEPSTVRVTCQLQGDRGPCLGNQTMYHYDWSTRRCTQFSYGGCLGNRNRFRSELDCAVMCGSSGEQIVTQLFVLVMSLIAISLTHIL